MKSKILVAFAMKEEFAPWRRRHRFHPVANSPHSTVVASFGSTEVYVTLVGAGAPDADRFHELATRFAPAMGIVTGVAAGLTLQWQTGDLLVAESICGLDGAGGIAANPNLIDSAVECGAKRATTLITVPRIARTVEDKVRLAVFADAADMESLPLVTQWSARGIPALALRVILDPADMPMACDFEAAMDAHGQVRLAKIMSQIARHPELLPDFLHLAVQSRRALKTLARFLDGFMEHLDRQFPAIRSS